MRDVAQPKNTPPASDNKARGEVEKLDGCSRRESNDFL